MFFCLLCGQSPSLPSASKSRKVDHLAVGLVERRILCRKAIQFKNDAISSKSYPMCSVRPWLPVLERQNSSRPGEGRRTGKTSKRVGLTGCRGRWNGSSWIGERSKVWTSRVWFVISSTASELLFIPAKERSLHCRAGVSSFREFNQIETSWSVGIGCPLWLRFPMSLFCHLKFF